MRDKDSEMKSGLDSIPEFKIPGEEEMSEMQENESPLPDLSGSLHDCSCLDGKDKNLLISALHEYISAFNRIIRESTSPEYADMRNHLGKLVYHAEELNKKVENTSSCS